MKAPICRVCGASHWSGEGHRVLRPLGKGVDTRAVVDPWRKPVEAAEPEIVRPERPEAAGQTRIKVGSPARGMSDEELRPYYTEWMRRLMARRRAK